MATLSSLYCLLLLCTITTFKVVAAGETFQVDLHHRFSDEVRQWAESQGLPAPWNPEEAPEGSAEYYAELARHDLALQSRHGRLLKDTGIYSFAENNETMVVPSLGYLNYAIVTVGTPNQTFLVAVTTRNRFFWLPCNCKQCASLSSPLYKDLGLSTYSINESSTSKEILCGSSQCNLLSDIGETCTGTSSNCPYLLEYATKNTSSSGFLVEDVLYLAKEDTGVDIAQVPILFGCGEVQTGDLLDTDAPNGMMGLGINDISVPSMLAKSGLVSDSFSMCFSSDHRSGRLNFGDKGSSDQSETSLIIDKNSPLYTIGLEGMVIGNTTSETSFTAEISSTNSYTYLTDQIYKEFTTTFTEQVTDTLISVSTVPFNYCYKLSATQTENSLPVVSLTTKGGSQFPVLNPIIQLTSNTRNGEIFLLFRKSNGKAYNVRLVAAAIDSYGRVLPLFMTSGRYIKDTAYFKIGAVQIDLTAETKDPIGYCLGILPSTDENIIGRNFLDGLRIVFNREDAVLGWEEFDCYSGKISSTTPSKTDKNASTPPPSTGAKAPKAAPSADAETPPTPDPVTNLLPRRKSWAPNLSPSTMLNAALSFFLLGSFFL